MHMNAFINIFVLLFIATEAGEASALFQRQWGGASRSKSSSTSDTNKNASTSSTTATTTDASVSNYTIPNWQKEMPDPLSSRRTLERIQVPLTSNTKVTVYLLGTSHISNDSSADVRVLLNSTHPQIVFLELCNQRINMLVPSSLAEGNHRHDVVDSVNGTGSDDNHTNRTASNAKFWDRVKMVQQTSGMPKSVAMGTILLTQVQDDYANSLGVDLGGEFQVAWEYCQVNRPICILGDRPLRITLLRAWESLSWWGKVRCLVSLLWSSLQKPNPEELREWMQKILLGGTDILTESMAELQKSFPTLERVILKERDAYLACKIFQTCRYLNHSENHTMVAIVGAGHVQGICKWLTDGNGNTPEEILSEIVQTKRHADVDYLVKDVTQLSYDHLG